MVARILRTSSRDAGALPWWVTSTIYLKVREVIEQHPLFLHSILHEEKGVGAYGVKKVKDEGNYN